MNIQMQYAEKILLMENLMHRMHERKPSGFKLDGIVTQAERNALHTALNLLKDRFNRLRLQADAEDRDDL